MQHTMHILNHTGHQTLTWTDGDLETIEAAKLMFNQKRGEGYAAFKVEEGGEKGDIINVFNPEEDVILSPALQGG